MSRTRRAAGDQAVSAPRAGVATVAGAMADDRTTDADPVDDDTSTTDGAATGGADGPRPAA